jgi:predicted double-glycine peptidase
LQAWASSPAENFGTDEDDGHYVVAIGFDDDHIYFEDPSIEKTRGFMRKDQFDLRWHDQEDSGEKTSHWGLVLGRPEEEAEEIG